jgi:glyoxylase-like metal-dependent hydrolase (beta-lactamase superfamily II)
MLRLEQHDDVVRLHMTTPSTRLAGYSVSAYLTRGALVDVGFPRIAAQLEAFLAAHRVEGVLLTHSHEDHAGNAPVVAALGLPVAAGEASWAILRSAPPIELYRRITWGQPSPVDRSVEPYMPDSLALVPSPGHAVDHHVVWDAERETVFGGDLFVGVKVRVAHEDEDPRVQVRSLRAVAALHPRRLFDGHRGLIRDPVPALIAKAEWMEETIGRIESMLDTGLSARAVAREILGREAPVYYASAGHYSHINFVRAVRRTR